MDIFTWEIFVIVSTRCYTWFKFLVRLSRRLKCTLHFCDHALSVVYFLIFNYFSEITARNSTKLDRTEDLITNVLCQVCVLRADRKKRWRPILWLAETFSTSPLNEFNLIGVLRHMQRYYSHICDGTLKKKLYLQSGSQRHRHFAGFLNVPVLHRHGTTLFSSPEPKARVSYCHSAPSVVRPSVRPSGVNFSHFRLLLQNRLIDFDETW